MKTIVVTTNKGGVGKTAISVHLAQYLEEQGKKVLVIDLDNQRNCSMALSQHASGFKAMQIFDGSLPKDLKPTAGLTLLVADAKLQELELGPKDKVLPALHHMLPQIGAAFDYCVIDTPPGLGLRVQAALIGAQFVLSPVELDDFGISGITDLLKVVFGIKQKINPDLAFVGMLPNRLNSASVAQKTALEELLAKYANYMVPAKIGNRTSIPEAMRAGVPVWRLKKSSAKDAGVEMLAAFKIIGERIGV